MSNQTTGKILAVALCVVVLLPLALLAVREPVKVGLPFGVFVLSGVVALVLNHSKQGRP